jgi:hypothetical protein
MSTDNKYNSVARKRPEYNVLEKKNSQVWIDFNCKIYQSNQAHFLFVILPRQQEIFCNWRYNYHNQKQNKYYLILEDKV